MNHICPKNISIIRKGKIIEGCELDINLIQGTETTAKNTRDSMRRTHAKDLVQLSEPRDFIKAYPDEAKKHYTEDTMRKFG